MLALTIGAGLWFASCGNQGVKDSEQPVDIEKVAEKQPEVRGSEVKPGDISLTNPLNGEWVTAGKGIYELKCQACHRLTADKLVGPGWKDVTKRRDPVWIMNMITNVDMMLEKDPEVQKLLEQCLVRMPNQNINAEDARKVIEFMRQNDGEK
ncbi:MAG: c-type cytochrome [Chitinophagaceae bacterium]|nr:c-type cytochrome [Chitinophagaceae bacterium]